MQNVQKICTKTNKRNGYSHVGGMIDIFDTTPNPSNNNNNRLNAIKDIFDTPIGNRPPSPANNVNNQRCYKKSELRNYSQDLRLLNC